MRIYTGRGTYRDPGEIVLSGPVETKYGLEWQQPLIDVETSRVVRSEQAFSGGNGIYLDPKPSRRSSLRSIAGTEIGITEYT